MIALRKSEAQPTTAAVREFRPTDIAVYLIHGGRMARGTVNTKLPYGISSTRFFPAELMPDAEVTLELVRSVATRCVPWVKVVVGPRPWKDAAPDTDLSAFRRVRILADGRQIYEIGGQAFRRGEVPEGEPEVIIVSSWTSPAGALGILHHEAWHVVERHIHDADFDQVDAAVSRGVALPGDYMDSALERRARLYEKWASAYDEGWRPVTMFGFPLARIDRVFLAVHRGDVAADHAAGRPSPPRLLPGERAFRAALGVAHQVRSELGWQGVMLASVAAVTLAHWL